MPRKKKTEEPRLGPPLNMSDDISDLEVVAGGCMIVTGQTLFGTLTILTPVGHYDFLINEATANELVQALRGFIAGDSPVFGDDD